MSEESEQIKGLLETVDELVSALNEQVTQKECLCQRLEIQLVQERKQNAALKADVLNQKEGSFTRSRQSVIQFPQMPVTLEA